jgi:hypothetical protein
MSRLITGLLVMATVTCALAQGGEGLKDIQRVYILIEDLQEDLIKDGLTQQALRKDVEGLVRGTGLSVLSLEESMEARPGQGILRLAITSRTVSEKNRIYAVRLDLRRKVELAGGPETQLMASTWHAMDLGMTPLKDMLEIRGTVRDLVGKFATDYREANPKASGASPK